MNDILELTPALLLEQSQEMSSLKAAYDDLFGSITSELNGINSSWSELLANNFSSKIGAAQKTFLGSLTMLQNSASATKVVADTFAEADVSWASRLGSSSLQMMHSALIGAVPEAIAGNTGAARAVLQDVIAGGGSGGGGGAYFGGMSTGKKIWKTAMALGKGALATVGCVGTWAAAVGTGGLAIPGAAISTAFTANTLANCGTDIYNLWWGDESKVGNVNYLKTGMTNVGGDLGEMLVGNREVGELVGKGVYNVGQIYTDITNAKGVGSLLRGEVSTTSNMVDLKDKIISKSPVTQYDKVIQSDISGKTIVKAIDEIPKAVGGGVDIFLNTPIQELGKDCKLLAYEVPNLVKTYKGGEQIYKFGKCILDLMQDGGAQILSNIV